MTTPRARWSCGGLERRLARLAAASWLATAALGCVASEQVERLVDGQLRAGRFVDERAYAYYARGRVLELSGANAEALQNYGVAQQYDEKSVELAVRVGATRCALRDSSAFLAFDAARDLDARYAPLWTELSRCYFQEGDRDQALFAAERAVSLDPSGFSSNAQMLTLLRAKHDTGGVRRWYRAFLAQRKPTPSTLGEFVRLTESDPVLLSDLQREHAPEDPFNAGSEPQRRLLLTALAAEDEPQFLALGTELNLGASRLANLALKHGKWQLASRIATRCYAADRTDIDSWVVLLFLSAHQIDETVFKELLDQAPTLPAPLSAESLEMLTLLLNSKVGVSIGSVPASAP